jgi:hypothetical protein
MQGRFRRVSGRRERPLLCRFILNSRSRKRTLSLNVSASFSKTNNLPWVLVSRCLWQTILDRSPGNQTGQTGAVEEFFELFKTPWESYRLGRLYDVILVTADEVPNIEAKLCGYWH